MLKKSLSMGLTCLALGTASVCASDEKLDMPVIQKSSKDTDTLIKNFEQKEIIREKVHTLLKNIEDINEIQTRRNKIYANQMKITEDGSMHSRLSSNFGWSEEEHNLATQKERMRKEIEQLLLQLSSNSGKKDIN